MTTTFNTGIVIYNFIPLAIEDIDWLISISFGDDIINKSDYFKNCPGFRQYILEVIPPVEPIDEHSLFKHIVWVEFASPDWATLAKLGKP